MDNDTFIKQEVARQVGRQTQQLHQEIKDLTQNNQRLKDSLARQNKIISEFTGSAMLFGTLLIRNDHPDPAAFHRNGEILVIDSQSPHYNKSGLIVGAVDAEGKVPVKLSDDTEIVLSIGVDGKSPAQIRLTTGDDGTYAVVSTEGKPFRVKGVPDSRLQPGDTVLLSPENQNIIGAGPDLNIGAICRVTQITADGVEVESKGETRIVLNPKNIAFESGDRVLVDSGFVIISRVSEGNNTRYKLSQESKMTWDDVGGLDDVKRQLQEAIELPFKVPELYKHYKVRRDRGVLMYGPPGCGKAQPLSATIYTPTGPIFMGEIKAGDMVCTPDGGATPVIGVFPQGEKEIYKVTFSDGSVTHCCAEHLWKVESQNGYKSGVLDTATLASKLKMKDGKRIYSIPMTKPVYFCERDHLLHPYLIGALLAEGHFGSSVSFTNGDQEMLDLVSSHLPHGYSLKPEKRAMNYDITRDINEGSFVCEPVLTREIRRMGLTGKLAHEKFVPHEYLYDSVRNRSELLRGLMDGDGEVSKNGMGCSISTSSPQLAQDIKGLVQSLGGICNVCPRQTYYRYKGEKRPGKVSYRCHISVDDMASLFTISRKSDRIIEKTKRFAKRMIESIDLVGKETAQCILVAHPDHLYITDDFVVTHNTLLARVCANSIADIHGAEAMDSGYIYVKGPELLDKWVGNTEAEIRSLFDRGRRHYRKHGYKALLAIEEAEAILPQRGSRALSISDTIVPMFLSEMDGIDDKQTEENPIILLLTNRPDIIDPAITRPGRISKHIKINRPDDMGAIDILRLKLKDVPFAQDSMVAITVAVSDLYSNNRILYRINNEHSFRLADAVSGAMLEAVAETAKMSALHRDMKSGQQTGLTLDDLRYAVNLVDQSQRGLNHSYDVEDFCTRIGIQYSSASVERCFANQ